mgnify:FL=1
MSLIIEKATTADIPALAKLLSELFNQEEEFTPDPQAQTKGLTKIITHPEIGNVILARKEEKVVGMVNLLFSVSTALGKRVALLEDMIITQSTRQAGIGTKLLTEAISYAKAEGCKRITLLTDTTNIDAQRFYKKQGFALSTMVPMRLAI